MEETIYTLKKRLRGDYLAVYDKVELYTVTHHMNGETSDDMLMNLMDLLLTAQKESRPVEKVVGRNVERFCHDYFEVDNREAYIRERLRSTCGFLWFVFIIEGLNIIIQLTEGNFDLWGLQMNVSGFVVGLFAGMIFRVISDIAIRPWIFHFQWMTMKKYRVFSSVVIFGLCMLGIFIFDMQNLQIPAFPVLLISGMYIFFYYAIRLIIRYQKTGSLRKQLEHQQEAEKENPDKKLLRMTAKGIIVRYERKNRRRIRRKKELLTPEEYTEKLRKDQNKEGIWNLITILSVLIIYGAGVYLVSLDSTWLDTLIFAGVLGVLEFAILYATLSATKRWGTNYMAILLDACKEENITVLDYGARLQEEDPDGEEE